MYVGQKNCSIIIGGVEKRGNGRNMCGHMRGRTIIDCLCNTAKYCSRLLNKTLCYPDF